MDPLTIALFQAGSTQLFKALVDGDGDGVGRKDIAAIAAALFEALLKMPKRDETLGRIETKVDRSLRQDFNRSYGMGVNFLGDAAHERTADEQVAALRSARQSFKEAAEGTESRGLKVRALHAAAGCSLLQRRPDFARDELDRAWREAFSLMKTAAQLWDNPTPNQRPGAINEFLFNTTANHKLRSRAEIEEEVSPVRTIIGDIENIRMALGSPSEESPTLEIPVPGQDLRPLRILARGHRVCLPDGSSVTITDVQFPTRTKRFWASAEVAWAADEVPGAAINAANLPPNFSSPQWYEERYPVENWEESGSLSINIKLKPPVDLVMIEFFAPPLTKQGPLLPLVRIGFNEHSLMGVGEGVGYGW